VRSVISRSIASSRTIGTGLIIGALAMTLAALLIPVSLFGESSAAALPSGVIDDGKGTISTQYGPLSAVDRDFVRKVKLAGLWELPSGRMAQERGGNTDAVKTAGEHLIEGHTELDRRSNEVGQALGIDLPTQPNEQQQGWLNEMTNAASPAEFQRVFANRLRAAHGKVFGLVAQVRAQSQNSMVRSLATRTNTVVLDHITVLEDTGLVDFEALNK
jgi:predicted outer membrane protein